MLSLLFATVCGIQLAFVPNPPHSPDTCAVRMIVVRQWDRTCEVPVPTVEAGSWDVQECADDGACSAYIHDPFPASPAGRLQFLMQEYRTYVVQYRLQVGDTTRFAQAVCRRELATETTERELAWWP